MCGIAGIYRPQGPVHELELYRMIDSLKHRGPDGEGVFVEPGIGFGHRRLSIIDLSQSGSQPMCNEDGSVWIVFNGEIYNYLELRSELKNQGHQFKSQTDTEVIIHAFEEYGTRCVEKLLGMFAFAIWNKRDKTLFCARDRFGIKPLYYFWDGEEFIFASEPSALLTNQRVAETRDPNMTSLFRIVQMGIGAMGSETCFRNISSLEPAEYLLLKQCKLIKRKYWKIEKFSDQGISDKDAIDKFRELFFDSVKLHLRSDVPVGTLLSGGIDSSSLVCVASKLGHTPMRTLSIYFDNTPGFDERKFAREVIATTGANPLFLTVKGKEIPTLLEKMTDFYDFPVPDSSALSEFALMKTAQQAGIKVLFNGQGSDEMLAGYTSSFPFYLTSLFTRLHWGTAVREAKQFALDQCLGMGKVLNLFCRSLVLSGLSEQQAYQMRYRLFGTPLQRKEIERNAFKDIQSLGTDSFTTFLYNLTFLTNLPTLLEMEDRNSMTFSVEVRVPFLDHRLVEWIFSLPPHFKVRKARSKWILREALKDLLPPNIYNRTDKMGLNTPGESTWLKEELKAPFEDILGSQSFKTRGIYDLSYISKLRSMHAKGHRHAGEFLWRVFTVENWFRSFIDKSRSNDSERTRTCAA